jgi:hypothetical protein
MSFFPDLIGLINNMYSNPKILRVHIKLAYEEEITIKEITIENDCDNDIEEIEEKNLVLNIDFEKSTKEKIYVNFFFNKIEYYTLYSKTESCIYGDFVIEGLYIRYNRINGFNFEDEGGVSSSDPEINIEDYISSVPDVNTVISYFFSFSTPTLFEILLNSLKFC